MNATTPRPAPAPTQTAPSASSSRIRSAPPWPWVPEEELEPFGLGSGQPTADLARALTRAPRRPRSLGRTPGVALSARSERRHRAHREVVMKLAGGLGSADQGQFGSGDRATPGRQKARRPSSSLRPHLDPPRSQTQPSSAPGQPPASPAPPFISCLRGGPATDHERLGHDFFVIFD